MKRTRYLITGGLGFVGLHFARLLETSNPVGVVVYLFDKKKPDDLQRESPHLYRLYKSLKSAQYLEGSVENFKVWQQIPQDNFDTLLHFAATHREPGHDPEEYYDTNIQGALNACRWAISRDVQHILFLSSISVYGGGDNCFDEVASPLPNTPYGKSKLMSEMIFEEWALADRGKRSLISIRPGVIFGPGEGGNVSRLASIVKRGYMFYIGNSEIKKSSIYIKELFSIYRFLQREQAANYKPILTVNGVGYPPPKFSDFVSGMAAVSGVKLTIINLPFWLLRIVGVFADVLQKLVGRDLKLNSRRIAKLKINNDINPSMLRALGYNFTYDLISALEEWYEESGFE